MGPNFDFEIPPLEKKDPESLVSVLVDAGISGSAANALTHILVE